MKLVLNSEHSSKTIAAKPCDDDTEEWVFEIYDDNGVLMTDIVVSGDSARALYRFLQGFFE